MRREERGRIAAVVAAIVVTIVIVLLAGNNGTPRRAPVPPPTPEAEQFGVNVNRLFDDRTYTPGQIDSELAAVRATGATLARGDALWEATEPTPPIAGVHHYDWAFDDFQVRALARHGLTWLPIIDYSAGWAQSDAGHDHSPPSSFAAYAAYAGALAKRYGPGGTFWSEHPKLAPLPVSAYEIWNEPDNPLFWFPSPNARRYAQLYLAARAAIHAADATAHVLVGGLTLPGRFLPAMVRAAPQLAGELDGVAIHPYGPTPAAVLSNVVAARRTLQALGLGSVPLFVTEFGWTTRPPGATDGALEADRPAYIERTIEALARSGCGIAATVLYTWATPERRPRDAQDWFGISPPGGGTSPDVAAFTRALRAAGGAHLATSCS
ncbi:MAG TPA: hypothetical protein VG410_08510 [Solirubrobacteraceae bacterium]|jgi:hypothetical protein|nr:hypothetical protein [Solirubrobacteraceae bacterium]